MAIVMIVVGFGMIVAGFGMLLARLDDQLEALAVLQTQQGVAHLVFEPTRTSATPSPLGRRSGGSRFGSVAVSSESHGERSCWPSITDETA